MFTTKREEQSPPWRRPQLHTPLMCWKSRMEDGIAKVKADDPLY